MPNEDAFTLQAARYLLSQSRCRVVILNKPRHEANLNTEYNLPVSKRCGATIFLLAHIIRRTSETSTTGSLQLSCLSTYPSTAPSQVVERSA
jgi:hypothetical protein